VSDFNVRTGVFAVASPGGASTRSKVGSFGSDGTCKVWECGSNSLAELSVCRTGGAASVNACAAEEGLVALGLGPLAEGQEVDGAVRTWLAE
jgi:hypothetical protein